MECNIMDSDHITVGPWGWQDSASLKRLVLQRYPLHAVHEWPSPIMGFNLTLSKKFPGKFTLAMERVMGEQREFMDSRPKTIIIGTPLLWLAYYRAAGGVVSSALVRQAASLFAAHHLAVLPDDSHDTSASKGVKVMCATWAAIHDIDGGDMPSLTTIEDFLAKI